MRPLLLVLAIASIAGCGLKGDLELPEPSAADAAAHEQKSRDPGAASQRPVVPLPR